MPDWIAVVLVVLAILALVRYARNRRAFAPKLPAISRGQRNNYSYGRMTLEEMKAHSFNFGEVYDALMENHPETVRNRVRDID